MKMGEPHENIVTSIRQLTDGSAVPADHSHTKLRPDGQQVDYVVLTPEERAKGFVKPVRSSYIHNSCGAETAMGLALAETYARDPHFYSGTFCCQCRAHFPLVEFTWADGEPMDPDLQPAWAAEKAQKHREHVVARIAGLKAELARLEAEEARTRSTT